MSYNPYRKYCGAWWKYWLNLPGDIGDFFKRLYEYAPILWNDRDWDYAFLLALIRFKLKRLRSCLEINSAFHAPTNFDRAWEIHRAEIILRNIEDDPEDEWSMHYSQWHIGKDLNEDCGAPEECRKALEESRQRTERNWHELWKHFDENMRGWWD